MMRVIAIIPCRATGGNLVREASIQIAASPSAAQAAHSRKGDGVLGAMLYYVRSGVGQGPMLLAHRSDEIGMMGLSGR